MQKYCEQDVEVTHELYNLIQKLNYSPEAIRLEHDFARCIHLQEAHGFHFDVASAKKLYASLANRRLELEKSLVSTFPNWKQYIGTFIPKRDNKTLLSKKEYNNKHPVPENSYGRTYGAHRDFLEFNLNQHKQLQIFCKKNRVNYSSSVWDKKSIAKATEQWFEYLS